MIRCISNCAGIRIDARYAAEVFCIVRALFHMQIHVVIRVRYGSRVFAGHAAHVLYARDGAAVDEVVVSFICGNGACVRACDATHVVVAGNGGGAVVHKIGKLGLFVISTDTVCTYKAAYVVVAGDFAVVAAVGDTAFVVAHEAAYVITGFVFTFRRIEIGFASDVRRIGHVGDRAIFPFCRCRRIHT